MKKYILFVVLVFFVGCNTREYYKPDPKLLKTTIETNNSLNSEIVSFTKEVATLQNEKVIPINKTLPKGFEAIDKDLAKKGSILLVDNKQIDFDNLIVTAKKNNNLIAIMFNDNHFELYDLNKNKTIAKSDFGEYLALRKFIARPYFYKDLILIPTLNGSLAIFDKTKNQVIRNIVVSKKDYFSNIIFVDVKDDSLIVASRDNILVIAPGVVFNKSYNIKHIITDDKYIYLFTIEGDVVKLNFVLKPLKKVSFKYANIIAPTISNNKIFFVENGSGSYLISLDKNLQNTKIYPLDCPDLDEVNTFVKNGILYIGNKFINLKDIK